MALYSLQQAVDGVEVLQHRQRSLRPEGGPECCGETRGGAREDTGGRGREPVAGPGPEGCT